MAPTSTFVSLGIVLYKPSMHQIGKPTRLAVNNSFEPFRTIALRRTIRAGLLLLITFGVATVSPTLAAATTNQSPTILARPFPLAAVRLLDGPFTKAVTANRDYLLAHDPDRLLAPFLREAGLTPRAASYGNWESTGLDGHTAGHYLSALATMIASGADTADGELQRRLDHVLMELERCQAASGDGYLGGVPGGRAFWKEIEAGRINAHGFGINGKWVPWYNLHKTFAGLRDVYLTLGHSKAREILVRYGDWCEKLTAALSDNQMQRMLQAEHGGMNEVLADLYAITGEEKFLRAARRFCHQAVLDPLQRQEDRLTGMHANTQIPKVIGLKRIATLSGDERAAGGAQFFWETVVNRRSVAFGGNSVSEHFNDPKDFSRMLEHREGPETCNTYNMLRLTEQLFATHPKAEYADYYERALYNHILASIHPTKPGYVYFTPIRPEHYRVYSQPEQAFWCCVGSGMENPGKYGEFIYSQAADGLYVNLFIASELSATNLGLTLQQETAFPDEAQTRLRLQLKTPATFTLHLRHPSWVAAGELKVRVNGEPMAVSSKPSSYLALRREWRDGDRVEMELPMRTMVEPLPDGSAWVAFLHGPIVLVAPAGTNALVGLRADHTRMGHVAHGPLVPLDRAPTLLASIADLPKHVVVDQDAGPLRFRIVDVVEPAAPKGLPLVPFFRLHDARYQMYWATATREEFLARRESLAAEERTRMAREAATLDSVAIGEQQSEVEHGFAGEETETGMHENRRWRHGRSFQYMLNTRNSQAAELAITYWGGDTGRTFDILVDGRVVATEELKGAQPGKFFERRYPIPADILQSAANGRITVKFVAKNWLAGGVYEVRLVRSSQN